MGCCQSHLKGSSLNSQFSDKLKEAIDSNCLKRLDMVIRILNSKSVPGELAFIDKEMTVINGRSYNPLAYSVLIGNEKVFKYLTEKGASIKCMEELLENQNLRSISIICLKGHLNLLKHYLPIYLSNYNSLPLTLKSFTIDLRDTVVKAPQFDLAIHTACRAGVVPVVQYLYKYFLDKSYCPREFDIKALDDYYGEDCALIACRSGHFPLIKMLHELCKCNFHNLNKHKENAIMICICGYRKTPGYSYIECLSYLVEIIKVDITYMHEETLLLAENDEIVSYLEQSLEKVGIYTKKKDIDKNVLNLKVIHEEIDNSRLMLFTDEVKGLLENDCSVASSITEHRSKILGSTFFDFMDNK
jgi:Ankyrin repeats (many copies)